MKSFTIYSNECLHRSVDGFYHTRYLGFEVPGNPDFLNHLKNTFDDYSESKLGYAVMRLMSVLMEDLPLVLRATGVEQAWMCCVPRSKALKTYSEDQLLFSATVAKVANRTAGLMDGSDFIKRHTSTRTTHLRRYDREGDLPYCGITKDTCYICSSVKGKDIILVDDIYTKTVNVIEDAVQALLDHGARSVCVYTVANTVKKF